MALFEIISFLYLAITLAVHCRMNFILFTSVCFVHAAVTFPFSASSKAMLETVLSFFGIQMYGAFSVLSTSLLCMGCYKEQPAPPQLF